MENKKCDCKDCQCGGTKQSTTAFNFWAAPDWSIFSLIEQDINGRILSGQIYDSEKYDLVEKKDYKIKKLKDSIEASKRQKDNNFALIGQADIKVSEYFSNIRQCDKDIKRLEQELQELESKKKE
jgi:hypothetical protein